MANWRKHVVKILQESRKGVTVTGSHDMEATGKQTKISWNFNFTRIKHWYQMKEALKSTARRSFGQCASALVWEWIHLLTRHGGSYKKVVFPHKLFIQIKTSNKLQCKKVYNLCWVALQFGFSLKSPLDTRQTQSVDAELEQTWNYTLALVKPSQVDLNVKLLPLFLFNGWD